MRVQVSFARRPDRLVRFGQTLPAPDLRTLSFELLVNVEEMLDFAKVMRNHIVDVANRLEAGIPVHHGQYLLVRLLLVHHLEHADRAHGEQDARETGLVYQREDIERISILGQGAGYKAIVPGIVHGGIERAIQSEHAEMIVVFVFVAGIPRDLNDHTDDRGRLRAGLQIVQIFHDVSV